MKSRREEMLRGGGGGDHMPICMTSEPAEQKDHRQDGRSSQPGSMVVKGEAIRTSQPHLPVSNIPGK